MHNRRAFDKRAPLPMEHSEKLLMVAFILCCYLGFLGAHRFYVGRRRSAAFQMFTLGGFAVWALMDLVMIVLGRFRDHRGRLVSRWE